MKALLMPFDYHKGLLVWNYRCEISFVIGVTAIFEVMDSFNLHARAMAQRRELHCIGDHQPPKVIAIVLKLPLGWKNDDWRVEVNLRFFRRFATKGDDQQDPIGNTKPTPILRSVGISLLQPPVSWKRSLSCDWCWGAIYQSMALLAITGPSTPKLCPKGREAAPHFMPLRRREIWNQRLRCSHRGRWSNPCAGQAWSLMGLKSPQKFLQQGYRR
jgi:hypothetical protein